MMQKTRRSDENQFNKFLLQFFNFKEFQKLKSVFISFSIFVSIFNTIQSKWKRKLIEQPTFFFWLYFLIDQKEFQIPKTAFFFYVFLLIESICLTNIAVNEFSIYFNSNIFIT